MALESNKTQTGSRPDLEQIEVNPVIGYIGNMIYPMQNVMTKTGTFYYKTLTADAAAQTSRAAGVAPARTLLTDSSTTFSCAERIKRYGVVYSEVEQMGGIEQADRLGGMASKRSVQRALEDAQAAKLMTSSRYAAAIDITDDPIEGMIWVLGGIKRYAGLSAMVFSETSFRAFISNTAVKTSLTYSFQGLSAEAILSRSPEVVSAALKGLYKIDMVLVGDDDHWLISGQEDAAAVVKLPSAEPFSQKMDPILGKTMLYMPDGSQPYEINSFPLDEDRSNNYDCTEWDEIKELNAAAAVLVKVGDPAVTTTTTSTTTTTTGG